MIRSKHPHVQRFPNGWAIRRLDGTILKILPVLKGQRNSSVKKEAIRQAKEVDLSPKADKRMAVNRSLENLPRVQLTIRRRSRGRNASPDRLYSIHVSVQLTLMSLMVDGSRKNRYERISLGEMSSLSQVNIDQAWQALYGAWAWATVKRQEAEVGAIFKQDVPADRDTWLALIPELPAPLTVQAIWDDYGYDQATGTDEKCRAELSAATA